MRIITYHDITNPARFAEQIAYLNERYDFVGLPSVRDGLLKGITPASDREQLVITFDDAYPSVYTEAFPVLKQLGIPATVFVISGLVGTEEPYWWEEIPYYAPSKWTAAERKAKVWEVKKWPDEKRLQYIQELKKNSPLPRLTRKQLGWPELLELQQAGWTIANHTHTHPMMDRCSTEEMARQVGRCRKMLDDNGCRGGRWFAYPNGNASLEAERILRQEGIELAFMFDHKVSRPETRTPLRVSRLSMDSEASVLKTWLIVSGLHSEYMKLRRSVGL
ncbi:polysaccharide deacetylase family protein [Lewinella sp. IMCC34191]|uniref:polysaccharide deacetylase family protein n=1 Tax=Lewinella sp. IMCC34191 TaxID=2259172 RepID=UPI000E23F949|nr:polysaccharide deacetylase family protein [Lewinella sp. IMCC34191]